MSILYPYSSYCAGLLANPPETGKGRHLWIFQVAASLLRQGAPPAEVVSRLTRAAAEHGWHDRTKEISGDVAKLMEHPAPIPVSKAILWPTDTLPAERARRGAFPTLFDPAGPPVATAADVLPLLFPGPALVCAATDIANAFTLPLIDILPIADRLEFVVANPMVARRGITAAGKASPRAKANATTDTLRRWLVIEFDTGETLVEQAGILSSLTSPKCPLTLAVFSGGKSLHGWFDGAALSPAERLAFFIAAAHLGCDRSLWDAAKLVRMPGGRRANGNPQPILYLNRAA